MSRKNLPLVSVLTPTIQGREWFLNRCRQSVKAQTYPFVEHRIIEGDGMGPTAAFQKTLDVSSGEYVMPVSDDDWIAPHAIEALASVLGMGNDVAFAKTLIVSPGNDRLTGMSGAVMWRRSLTDRIGGFDTKWKLAADTDLYGRFATTEGIRIGYTPEPLYFLNEHVGSGSYVHADDLVVELEKIHALYPDAVPNLELIANGP